MDRRQGGPGRVCDSLFLLITVQETNPADAILPPMALPAAATANAALASVV
jgi:hypothetical protein